MCFTPAYANLMKDTLQKIKYGMRTGGFVIKHLKARYTDEEATEYSNAASKEYVDSLKKATPETIRLEYFYDFIIMFEESMSHIPDSKAKPDKHLISLEERKSLQVSAPMLLDKMVILTDNATHKAGVNRKLRWSKYHTQILIWAIPFVYFSVTPFFNALAESY